MLDVLLASAIAINQPEPNWVSIAESATAHYYLDNNSIRGRGTYRTIDYYRQSQIGEKEVYGTYYLECSNNNLMQVTNIKKPDRRKLEYQFPNTVGRYVLEYVCPMIKK